MIGKDCEVTATLEIMEYGRAKKIKSFSGTSKEGHIGDINSVLKLYTVEPLYSGHPVLIKGGFLISGAVLYAFQGMHGVLRCPPFI